MVHMWRVVGRGADHGAALHVHGQSEVVLPVSALMERAERTAGQLVDSLGRRPARLGLLLGNGEPWVRALLAAWRLDATAVPLPLPVAFRGSDAYASHLSSVVRSAALDAILVDGELGPRTLARVAPALPGTPLLDVSAPAEADPPATGLGRGGDGLAVLQYTSGSTSRPKGVTLTHDNVAAGITAILGATRATPADVLGLWVPLFHDMGLFSLLTAVSRGMAAHLWRSADAVRRPMSWLAEFGAARGTIQPAPNFFYDHLVASARRDGVPDGLDLSAWKVALNGAEPVSERTARAFVATFRPYGLRPDAMHPSYGMAEATLMVTFPRLHAGLRTVRVDRDQLGIGQPARPVERAEPRARSIVSCGLPATPTRVRVVDAGGVPCRDGVVGEVQIAGPAVSRGYLDVPPEEQPVTAGGWLRTGDLGFLLDGELYVVGWLKAMIIVHGQNYFAEDVEEVARTTPGVDWRRCAAFAWDGGGVADADQPGEERIVVLWETGLEGAPAAQVAEAIRTRLADHLGLSAVEIVAVPPATIPVTSSGKVKRSDGRRVWKETTKERAGAAGAVKEAVKEGVFR